VEIDPQDPNSTPVKRTALGRFKHESAEIVEGKGGRIVAYMGDDERFDYIYKFVSAQNWKAMRAQGRSPLDEGTLYVARFNDDNTGDWLPLTPDNPALADMTLEEILVFTRLAADKAGATPMDRPEWVTTNPYGDVFCALTNNSRRTEGNAANPLVPNPFGHIIRWRDSQNHTGTTFEWDIFFLAKDSHGDNTYRFGSPDGLWADDEGRLFIQTDGDQPGGINNQMVVADTLATPPVFRRLFAGVAGDEITGMAVTPDGETMFINTQHPGDGDPAVTNFPVEGSGGPQVPRDATIVITKIGGGTIGS
jgi:secreted PhoX family phosphatase